MSHIVFICGLYPVHNGNKAWMVQDTSRIKERVRVRERECVRDRERERERDA